MSSLTTSRRHGSLWLPSGCALALSLLVVFWASGGSGEFGDAHDYRAAARALLEGREFPRESSLPFFRPPLYPFFISLLWRVAPASDLAVKLAQAGLFAGTCWLLCWLAVAVHGDRRAALAGAFLYTVNPFPLLQAAGLQTETLHAVLMVGAVVALTRVLLLPRHAGRAALGAGVLLGLAALCRPTALPVAVALAVSLVLARRPLFGDRAVLAWRYCAALLLGLAIPILPWTAANWSATGHPFLVTDGAGYHLWLGNHPATLRLHEGEFASREEFRRYGYDYLQQDLPRSRMDAWERSGGYRALPLAEREARWRAEAWQNIGADPGLAGRLFLDKAWAFWRPWLHPGAYAPRWVLASGVAVGALYLLAGLGAARLGADPGGRQFVALLALLFLWATAAHALTHSMVRFRLPYVDPFLCLLAGFVVRRRPAAASLTGSPPAA